MRLVYGIKMRLARMIIDGPRKRRASRARIARAIAAQVNSALDAEGIAPRLTLDPEDIRRIGWLPFGWRARARLEWSDGDGWPVAVRSLASADEMLDGFTWSAEGGPRSCEVTGPGLIRMTSILVRPAHV